MTTRAAESGYAGSELHALLSELYPICRSLTGEGVRETLRAISKHVPLRVHSVASGTQAFDWTVPLEWNIRDAYVKDDTGARVVDFHDSNLHVMGYSEPVHEHLDLPALRSRIYSLPEQPAVVPFRTSYFKRDWGFSMAHEKLLALKEGRYEVRIDSTLEPGELNYGEYVVPGETDDEVLISAHVCHPSLANDNLSGVVVAAFLAAALGSRQLRYSYRFLWIPAQIGSIVWLSRNAAAAARIKHGLVLVALGDAGAPTYKRSQRCDTEIDRAAVHVLAHRPGPSRELPFFPHGNDERQYCSPGFNLPVGALMRTPCGRFPEYHTSADNTDFVQPAALADSLDICLEIVDVLEGNRTYVNLNPMCEPQLGRRGLYRLTGDVSGGGKVKELPMLWVLNQSDGTRSLLDIAERSGTPFADIRRAADALLEAGLLSEKGR